MRERRLVVADAMHDREMAVLVEALEPRHGRLKAEMLIDLAQAFLPDADAGPRAVVGVIAIGHDRIEAVVAAGQFDHHQDATVLCRLRGGRLRPERRALEIARRTQDETAEAGAQEIAAGDATKAG
jgi:hypothetical protein